MKQLVVPFLLTLGACAQPQSEAPSRAAISESSLPPMKVFATPRPVAPARANGDIARDFLDLAFKMESGRELPVMTRFEGPITVRVTGSPPSNLVPDLKRLMARLRREAGIDIHLATSGDANITIESVTRTQIRRALPQAACFVAPNVSSLSQYRAARRSPRTDWTLLQDRERLSIFLPNDTSPQEVRDCLHEELAQALGPLNDLYRLPDSVFNDDNVHAVLTGFDMLILRAYYDPALKNGMTRAQVASRLPAILARINPRGQSVSPLQPSATPRAWINAIHRALGPGANPAERRTAARLALQIAKQEGWQDHRLGFTHYALGRLLQGVDAEQAYTQFLLADQAYRRSPHATLHRGYVTAQLAAQAISSGRGQEALALLNPLIPVAARHENAELLATLMLLRAEALELQGKSQEAGAVRLDSLGWARYGFGPDWAVRAKLREIASLSPLKGRY
ncbi:DUF2927 domain-containing protein [Pelagimonas sp. KU-00592-HH]|uniref:DUF2927 domain-containing protein n=1 Tax=Roseobacteraceae TaxID=2854170 RepID=UPI0020CBD1B1|nr:DUF2927 domain-containing protein [Shimia sp. CNT1-13L.2]MCP9481952.1 DUF2927 domain-containing protein [Shimia sp. CNT1-13L.2]